MFEQVKSLLTSSDPAILVGSSAALVFVTIWLWRKLLPSSWHWIESHIPLIDRIENDAIWTFSWKTVQSLPGTALGAIMTAIASGGDVRKTLLGALAGPVAAIGHELLKRYKGQTSKPGNRSLPPPALAFMLLCGFAGYATGCGLFAPSSPLWPVVRDCIPSGADLVERVKAILIEGGDTDAKLAELAKQAGKDGKALVVCALHDAIDSLGSRIGASPARTSAAARGREFLARTGNQ